MPELPYLPDDMLRKIASYCPSLNVNLAAKVFRTPTVRTVVMEDNIDLAFADYLKSTAVF